MDPSQSRSSSPSTSTTSDVPRNGQQHHQQRAVSPSPSPSPSTSTTKSLSAAESAKVTQILQACRDGDFDALAALATTEGGLVEDTVRKTAWPILLGANNDTWESDTSWKALPPHRDEDQVKLDVHRSFVYYPKDESDQQIERRKQELLDLITEVLRRYPSLCYFQGYHDIVQVLLLVLGPQLATPAVVRLSLLRIRDFMLPSLDGAMAHLHLLPAILHAADPVLCEHLSHTLAQPFFALSATLTLYAHDIEQYGQIARLFDFLLAHEAAMSLYLFAVIIRARRAELLDIRPDEPDMLHAILSKLPKPLDLEALIAQTTALRRAVPPTSLPRWRAASPYSVLKTTHHGPALRRQSPQDGERLLARQEAQLRRARALARLVAGARRRLWVYRRPAGALGLAVLVGVFAWWVGAYSAGAAPADAFPYAGWRGWHGVVRRVWDLLGRRR